jgi:membrane protein
MFKEHLNRIKEIFTVEIWRTEIEELASLKKIKVIAMRAAFVLFRDFRKNNLPLHAAALTNITVMSMIPTLAFIFALAKGLEIHGKLKEASTQSLAKMPPDIQNAANTMFELIENTNFKALGTIGILVTLFTALSMMSKIENSFNIIWGVKKSRDLMTKIKEYLFIFITLPPILMITVSANAFLASSTVKQKIVEGMGLSEGIFDFYSLCIKLISPMIVALGFTFLYRFLPNTKVKFQPAFIASFIITIAWSITNLIYIKFQIGVSSNPIYGTFAIIPFFLLWLFVAWMIILLGAQMSFALQNHETYEIEEQYAKLKGEDVFNASILICTSAARMFIKGETWQTHQRLSNMKIPHLLGRRILDQLTEAKIMIPLDERQERYQPGRDIQHITLLDIHDAVMSSGGVQWFKNDDEHPGIEAKDIELKPYLASLEKIKLYQLICDA